MVEPVSLTVGAVVPALLTKAAKKGEENLADAAKALQQAATHHTRGKIVLKIADEPGS